MLEHPKIKNHIEEILRLMNIEYESAEYSEDGDGAKFEIKTKDSHMLIGQHGATLAALNHILKRIAVRGTADMENEKTLFYIDVNGYQSQLFSEIKTKAKVLAERAKSLQADIEMDPMSSYERMMVHSFLSGDAAVETESKGEGRNRRVVIKYKN